MTRIAQIVSDVLSHPAPVVFLDSCSLLDVVRAPARNKADEVRVAQQFLACKNKDPQTLHLIIASPTRQEWEHNVESAAKECLSFVERCDAIALICDCLALSPVARLPAEVSELPKLLRELSASLLSAAIEMDYDAEALKRAAVRIMTPNHPVKMKGTGARDALILEHVLETTKQLRDAKFAAACVFVSSNTDDFSAKLSTLVHPELARDFGPISLLYAISLTHAERELLAAGWAP